MANAIVSTVYPSTGGVATYTKYLFDEMKKIDENVILLGDKLETPVEEDKNIIRCWEHKPKFGFQIIKQAIKLKIKKIHIQQELHLFGSKLTAFLLPFYMLLLRILGKEVIITLHGVVPLKEVNEEFLKENGYSGSPFVMKIGLNVLYSFLCFSANKVIVHEEKFQEYLKDYFASQKKVYVVKHGIKGLKELIEVKKAKEKLKIKNDKYTFLYFGYVTGYKGIELIIEALKELKDTDFNFLVVGSRHPRLKEEESYKEYYNNIKNYFENDKRCIFFDYAPEEEVNYFFRAAECSVFPYNVQMSSSGPMALAIANETLVIASDSFEKVVPDELIFKRNKEALIEKLKQAKSSSLDKYHNRIKEIKQALSWKNIARQTMEVWER